MQCRLIAAGVLFVLSLPLLCAAQATDAAASSAPSPPPFLTRVEGAATLIRNAVHENATVNMPVIDGDRLASEQGRLAVQWPDGVVAALDEDSIIDVPHTRVLRLVAGHVLVFSLTGRRPDSFRILTANAVIDLDQPGRLAVSVTGSGADWQVETVLDVAAGAATLSSEGGHLPVLEGETALVRGLAGPVFTSRAEHRERGDGEPLESWSAALTRSAAVPATTDGATYLPSELQVYAPTLGRYGSWDYGAAEGWVWYPRVAVTWTPYSVGTWQHVGRYGWFWVGSDPWAWPTHHYGRWGVGPRGRWYWRPHDRWAPAWVTWAVGPGYVSWCALGWNGAPIYPAPFGAAPIGGRDLHRSMTADAPWRGWVTVPSRSFGRPMPVHDVAVSARAIPVNERRAFVTQQAPPRVRGDVAAPWSSGDAAVPSVVHGVPRASPPAVVTGRHPGGSQELQHRVPRYVGPPAPYAAPVRQPTPQRSFGYGTSDVAVSRTNPLGLGSRERMFGGKPASLPPTAPSQPSPSRVTAPIRRYPAHGTTGTAIAVAPYGSGLPRSEYTPGVLTAPSAPSGVTPAPGPAALRGSRTPPGATPPTPAPARVPPGAARPR